MVGFAVKKKFVILLLSLLCVCGIGVSVTLAYLTASPNQVENSFTIGNIDLSLSETTGNSYALIPGTTIKKDPKVTVKSGSESCWVFVEIQTNETFKNYISFTVNESWTVLGGVSGVYYLQCDHQDADQIYGVILGDSVQVKDTLTETKMNGITDKPVMRITAYAVQSHNVTSVTDAWHILQAETNA